MATYVFVPGAGGAAWYWHLVGAELERRGHEAIAVDLPAADEQAGLIEYRDVVVQAIDGRRGVVLVALSFGGMTAPLVCDAADVALLVLVNAMVPAPGESPSDWWGNVGHEAARRAAATREGWDLHDESAVFFHDVPAHLVAESAQHDPPQAGRPFDAPWPSASWPDVPTRFILGRDDRFFPADLQRRVVRERLGIEADEIDGGHLNPLSRPREIAAQLEAYRLEYGIA